VNDMKKINVVTLGCSKNLVDSEVLMRQIEKDGIEILTDSDEFTDTVVINTCGFIADAKQESIDTILEFAKAKKDGLIKNLVVMGCLSERYKEDLKKEIPEVDAYFGVNELPEIIHQLGFDFKKDLLGERKLTSPSHYAYLKIAEGCDRSCSFCAIPMIRGKHISKSIETIVDEARFLVKKGVKELILISQDLTYYGLDNYHKKMLPALLEELVKIEELQWIRLHYLYPTAFPMELLAVIRDHEKICSYIDIPLQHINSQILSSMQRGVDHKKTQELIDQIRTIVPEAYIRTAFIVGYPGETEKRYAELKDFIVKNRFERLGLFAYSAEEGTKAFDLKNIVSKKKTTARIDELMDIQENISMEINASKIGQELQVLIDRKEGDFFVGRSQYDSPEIDNEVLVSAEEELKIGTFCQVVITDVESFDLFGSVDLRSSK
jgi:ribosomal protein S12 methylthiotransferase